ncbi:MAG TPA: DNA mismatch repair endonuclease MutL [Candidatus Ornithomonoglobus intestinigallinarum]|uniref:DNA mismatch repair protein MutL n=1 Tax=Candidatus Ornithomonoglobus intestinigallinarum TaxID=2840894 RepID=A0A9D1H0P3_9FIRM|nr:DNA mismatch repair endonuclease MutL [Candidatus Ornithomonoglobus intestinigallinarum]
MKKTQNPEYERTVKMGIINLLPSGISNKIAAGEVVERPASVVKELAENSIDAGAAAVTIEIEKGGSTYIRVTDNGCGMSPEDARICFLRHATSKIKTDADLDAIYTLGFRGEALSSIGAVARVSLYTRKKDGKGVCVRCEGGEIISSEEAGLAEGTSVIVRDLFYNTPARAKFLKKDSTEAGYITDVVSRLIFAHTEVSFRLVINGKEKLFSPGDSSLKNAVSAVYGRDFGANLIPVNYDNDGFRVTGVVGNGSVSRSNRSHESFFVNKRWIKSPRLTAALEEAFKNQIMIGKFPLAVLNIETDPHFIDINVHPTKLEVKFSDEKKAFQTVYYGVKNALYKIPEEENEKPAASDFLGIPTDVLKAYSGKFDPRKNPFLVGDTKSKPSASHRSAVPHGDTKLTGDTKGADPFALKGSTLKENYGELFTQPNSQIAADASAGVHVADDGTSPRVSHGILRATGAKQDEPELIKSDSEILKYKRRAAELRSLSAEAAAPAPPQGNDFFDGDTKVRGDTKAAGDTEIDDYSIRIVGQLFDTYIIAEENGEMIMIDQHAAHERQKYEELLAELSQNGIYSQMLIVPVEVALGGGETGNYIEAEAELKKLGFDCRLEDNTVFISAVPADISMSGAEDLLTELITQFGEGRNELISETRQRLLYTIACKAAVKANHALSEPEARALVKTALSLEKKGKGSCPHGRPMIIRYSKRDIEKAFKRIV